LAIEEDKGGIVVMNQDGPGQRKIISSGWVGSPSWSLHGS
jgi:hypothetical protein